MTSKIGMDEDLQRRLGLADGIVKVLFPTALGWCLLSLTLGAYQSALGPALAMLGLAAALLLKSRFNSMITRVIWLVAIEVGMFISILAVHPSSYASFLLLIRATIPLMVFSPRENKFVRWGLVGSATALWCLAWWLHRFVLTSWEVGEALASSFFAPLTGLTVFLAILFAIGYFDRLSSRYVETLQKTNLQLETANAARSRFLKTLTHEMRTPLHTITGYADLVRKQGEQQDDLDRRQLLQRLEHIQRASNELLAMIEKGINLATYTSGGVRPACQDIDLSALVQQVLEQEAPMLHAREIEIDNQLQDDLSAYGDPELLQLALQQLLDNVFTFCPPGSTVAVVADAVSAKAVQISFADDGPGFADGGHDTAFEPFEKLGHSLGSIGGGGLGLALLKTLIEAMNGSVGVDSAYRKGAKVWVRLPVAR